MTAPRRIFIASDHAGFALKEKTKKHLADNPDFDCVDLGTDGEDSVDYPDFGKKLARHVLEQPDSLGIAICGSGIGISIAANRYRGIRAACVANSLMAKLAKEHNNANVLALGSRIMTENEAIACVDAWLKADFEGGRHQRRLDKLDSDI